MVDEDAGAPAATESAPDLGWHPVGANPSDPGWYPSGENPNEQAYWDGQTWTAKRRWTVSGWVEEGAPAAAAASGAGAAAPRLSANPYSPAGYSKPKTTPATVSVGLLLIMVSGIALMYGSVGSWIRLTGSVGIAGLHLNVNGTDPGISQLIGVNGWVTFIAGIVLLVFAGLSLTTDDTVLAVLTALVAGATLVFAIYDMVRVIQKIQQVTTSAGSSISVGWGLIAVLSAAVLAMLVSLVRLVSR